MKKVLRIVCILLVLCTFIGCTGSSGMERQQPSEQSPWQLPEQSLQLPKPAEAMKFVYLCADMSIPDYRLAAEGFMKRCRELGVEGIVIDCKGREYLFISAVEELESLQVQAVVVTSLSDGLGPLISSACKELGIELVCVMSRLKNTEGQILPYVGIDAYACGTLGGRHLAGRVRRTELLVVITPTVSSSFITSVITNGYLDALGDTLPENGQVRYIMLEPVKDSVEAHTQLLQKHLGVLDEQETYLYAAYSDIGAFAFLHYMAQYDFPMEQVAVCSVGAGEYAEVIFADESIAKAYSCILYDAEEMGATAAQLAHSALRDGEDMRGMHTVKTEIITSGNVKEFFFK